MPQFDLTIFSAQIFWLFIFFTILMVYTVRVAVPRMRDILDERWQRTEGFKITADRFKVKAADIDNETDTVLQDARKNAQYLMAIELDKFTQRMETEKNEILKRFQDDFKIHEQALQKNFEQVVQTIDPETVSVTALIIDRILGMKTEGQDILKHMNDNIKKAVAK